MKAAVAQFIFESNTFNPEPVELELFTHGGTWQTTEPSVRAWAAQAPSQMSGSLRVLEAAGWQTAPVFAAMTGSPAGRLSPKCFAQLRSEMARALRAALPADALLLHLHGAACAVGEDDVEGHLLAMVRDELGYRGVVVLSLDLHANVTRRMLQHADAVTAYRTMPHSDFVETGARAARLALRGRRSRSRTLAKMAALIPPTDTSHTQGRFAQVLGQARRMETTPGIEDVSVFPVQPWLDVAEMGSSVVITSDNAALARPMAEELAAQWYAQRRDWRSGVLDWSEIKGRLQEQGGAPWILVDSADATTGGSAGRSAEALRQLLPLANRLPGAVLLWVVDRAAVAQAGGCRHGRFRLGRPPVEWTAEVIFAGEGRYRARGGAYTGQEFSMGRTVVLCGGQLRVVVSSEPVLGADPAFYECVGLVPDQALAVQVKSFMGWRAGFNAGGERGLIFDGPGCSSLLFSGLPFGIEQRARLFPLNENPPNPVTLWQSN